MAYGLFSHRSDGVRRFDRDPGAVPGPGRRAPMTSEEIAFARSRRALGASWQSIGKMLGGRYAEDVRIVCETVAAE